MNAFELRSKDGKSVAIEKEWTRFGRADDNDIVVRDQAVSRYHLNFYVKDGSLIVEDAGSQNGFLVNGQLATGAVYLKAGDRISVGTMEYAIRLPGTPETATAAPRPTGFASSFTNSAASVSLPDDPSKKRIRLYAIAAVGLLLFAVLSKDQDATKKPAGNETPADAGLSSKGYRPDSYKTMSISEIRSEAKLREAKRDYDNGNYSRAHLGFQESLTLNPENDDAKAYLQYAEEQLEKQIAELQRDANKSMENLQYRRAKSQALRILTILSEQIAGYGRKVAQDAALTPEQRRPAGQEEAILEIPCNSTRNEKACKDALDMIREARRRLGEEDALR